MHPVQRITDRIRKLGLQQKKVCDPFLTKFGSAGLAVSLECGTTAHQANPVQIIRMLVDHKTTVQQNTTIACPLDIFAELDKVPGLVMIHSGGGDTTKPGGVF